MSEAGEIYRDISANPGSPGRAVFNRAWNDIWSGRRDSPFEIFFWTALAVYSGFAIFGYVSTSENMVIIVLGYIILIGFTPLSISAWVYRSHYIMGLGDEALVVTPLRSGEVLYARFLAVILSWLKLFGPLMLLVLVAIGVGASRADTVVGTTWADYFQNQLSFSWMSSFMSDPTDKPSLLITSLLGLFTATQLVGWITLPVAWGLMVASWTAKNRGSYILYFYIYLIFPIIIIIVSMLATFGVMYTFGYFGILSLSAPVSGLTGLVLSAVFLNRGIKIWQGRVG